MKKQNFKRADRVADTLKKEIAKLFLFDINDARFSNINITEVKLSPDLSIAKIYYVRDEYNEDVHNALTNVKSFIKKNISKTLSLRKIPDLNFYYDDVFEAGFKIDLILNKIKD